MSLILGLDTGVFIAWIGTLLAALACVFYGIYHEFIKKTDRKNQKEKTTKPSKKQGET
jgi:hypothetical protein